MENFDYFSFSERGIERFFLFIYFRIGAMQARRVGISKPRVRIDCLLQYIIFACAFLDNFDGFNMITDGIMGIRRFIALCSRVSRGFESSVEHHASPSELW